MNRWVAGSILGLGAVAIVGAIGRWHVVAVTALLASILLTAGWFINKFVWVRVPDLETALVFNAETKAFIRFLLPGRHWLLFPLERVRERLSLTATVVRGKCLQAQTNGGIAVTVDWTATYVINPRTLAGELWPHMARILPQGSARLMRSHGNNVVGQMVSELPVAALTDEGSRGRLERQLRERLGWRLRPFGFQIFRVMITKVGMPPQVQAMLEAAHERQVYAISEATALERLQRAVSQFSKEDMERLLQLKQLHVLGQNGVALPAPILMQNMQPGGWSRGGGADREGRKPSVPGTGSSEPADGGQSDWPFVTN